MTKAGQHGTVTLWRIAHIRFVRRLSMVWLATACVVLPVERGESQGSEPNAVPVGVAGGWSVAATTLAANAATSGAPDAGQREWAVRGSVSADGRLLGSVTVAGSPLIEVGSLEGRIDGDAVLGEVRDAAGERVATITGRVTASGAQGRFEDVTGSGGSWQFDGAIPRPVAAE